MQIDYKSITMSNTTQLPIKKDGYASRKFILAMLGLVTSSALIWYGKISGGDYVTLNSVLGGAYMAANAYTTNRNTH